MMVLIKLALENVVLGIVLAGRDRRTWDRHSGNRKEAARGESLCPTRLAARI
jgi:hypothetical protein